MSIDTAIFAGIVVVGIIAVVVWAIWHPGDKRPWPGRGRPYDWSNGSGGTPGQYGAHSGSDRGGDSSGSGDWGGGGVGGGGGGGDSGGGGGGGGGS